MSKKNLPVRNSPPPLPGRERFLVLPLLLDLLRLAVLGVLDFVAFFHNLIKKKCEVQNLKYLRILAHLNLISVGRFLLVAVFVLLGVRL